MSQFKGNPNLPPWLQDVPLPSRPQDAIEGAPLFAGLPDWLHGEDQETRGEPTAPAADAPWLSETPAPPADEETPDWLRDPGELMQRSRANADEPAMPAWLQSPTDTAAKTTDKGVPPLPPSFSDTPEQAPSALPPIEPERPSWIQGTEKGAEPQRIKPFTFSDSTEETPAPAAETERPDWLDEAGLADDQEDLKPFSFEDFTDEPAPAATSGAEGPSWLTGGAEPQAADTTPADELPSWLRELPADQPPSPVETPPAAPGSDIMPAWLRNLTPGDQPAAAPAPSQPAPIAQSGGLPSWLNEIGETPDQPGAETPGETSSTLPDWLSDVVTAAPTTAESAEPLPDWLRDAVTAEPTAAESTEPLPDWLRDTAATAPASIQPPAVIPPAASFPATPPTEPAPTQDLPDWLRDATTTAPTSAEPPSVVPPAASFATTPPTEPAPAQDLPDWLRAAAATEPATFQSSTVPPATPPQPTPDVPDWMRDIAANPPAPATTATPAGAGVPAQTDDLPAWLRDVAPIESGESAAPPPTLPSITAEAVPDWLTDLSTDPAAESTASQPAASPTASSDLPDWLQSEATGETIPPWLQDESGSPLPTAGAPGDANLPDWLRGAEMTPVAGQQDATTRPAESRPAASSGDLLGGMELPKWLRVEPETKPETPAPASRQLDWLTRLGGGQEDEAILTTGVGAPKLALPPTPTRSATQREALVLLNQLAAEPIPGIAPLTPPVPVSALQRIGLERLLSIILLILLIVAVAMPGFAPALEIPPTSSSADALSEQIAGLGENDVVLIGYEWDARRVGELRPLERAIIGQLIAQRVKLVLLSTDPQGTLLQFELLDTLRASEYRQQGEGFLLLGYKPGGEMALRSLGRDLQGMLRADYRGDDATRSTLISGIDTGRPIQSLNDFALILVLADDTPDVQGWMEQVYPLTRGAPPVPFGFLLPEEAAPIVRPYMNQPDVYYVAGTRGALAYAALDQSTTMPAATIATEAERQRLATLLFVAVLLIGLVSSGIAAAIRRRS